MAVSAPDAEIMLTTNALGALPGDVLLTMSKMLTRSVESGNGCASWWPVLMAGG